MRKGSVVMRRGHTRPTRRSKPKNAPKILQRSEDSEQRKSLAGLWRCLKTSHPYQQSDVDF
jgi:hypothetical protein